MNIRLSQTTVQGKLLSVNPQLKGSNSSGWRD